MSSGDGPRFGLVGAAGYVAPRHMEAIHAVGGELVLAHDPVDSVGVLDRRSPRATFFTDEREFWRHAIGNIDWLSICTPNHTHSAYAAEANRFGINVICEKPACLTERDGQWLKRLSNSGGARIMTVLQLRYHPAIVALREKCKTGRHKVTMRYVTRRGQWYDQSWKADVDKSGGVVMNIGIHLFDMLLWCFGAAKSVQTNVVGARQAWGALDLERADVDWLLSVNEDALPDGSGPASRRIEVDGEPVDFTGGFEDLHTVVYREAMAGRGFDVAEALPALDLVRQITGASE